MYLKKSKNSSGRIYLSIVHSYRENGKSKSKTVKGIGYVDELEKEYDDPIEHFTQVVSQMEAKRRAQQIPTLMKISPQEEISQDGAIKNLGFCALSKIYHSLNIDLFAEAYVVRNKLSYNLDSTLQMLTYEQILSSADTEAVSYTENFFFENFKNPADYSELSRSDVAQLSLALQHHLQAVLAKSHEKNDDIVYLNLIDHFHEGTSETSSSEAKSDKKSNPPAFRAVVLSDKKHLPISYAVFPNTSAKKKEVVTAFAHDIQTKETGRMIILSGSDIDAKDKVCLLTKKRGGYLHLLPPALQTPEIKQWVLSSQDYLSKKDGTKIKSRLVSKTLKASSKHESIKITEKQVAVYSPKHAYHNRRGGENLSSSNDEMNNYFVIVTSETWKTDIDIRNIFLHNSEVIDFFRSPEKISDVTHPDLMNENYAKAYFLVSFLAATILCLLKSKINNVYSITEIATSLRSANGFHLEENWWMFTSYNDVLAQLSKVTDIDFSKKYLRKSDIDQIIRQTKR